MGAKISFLATFPMIQTAIKVDGSGGMRIQLDIPETQMANAVRLLALRQCIIQVTVEKYEQTQANSGGDRTPRRAAAKRRIG
mgnify:CR=1 FL=1